MKRFLFFCFLAATARGERHAPSPQNREAAPVAPAAADSYQSFQLCLASYQRGPRQLMPAWGKSAGMILGELAGTGATDDSYLLFSDGRLFRAPLPRSAQSRNYDQLVVEAAADPWTRILRAARSDESSSTMFYIQAYASSGVRRFADLTESSIIDRRARVPGARTIARELRWPSARAELVSRVEANARHALAMIKSQTFPFPNAYFEFSIGLMKFLEHLSGDESCRAFFGGAAITDLLAESRTAYQTYRTEREQLLARYRAQIGDSYREESSSGEPWSPPRVAPGSQNPRGTLFDPNIPPPGRLFQFRRR